jgi:hypothetical protein
VLNLIKIIIVLGILWTGVSQWKKTHAPVTEMRITEITGLPGGAQVLTPPAVVLNEFTVVTPPGNMPPGKVFILAPACGNEADAKANELERRLKASGIPYARTAEVQFSGALSLAESLKVQAVMSQPLPLVFVRNRAQSGPTPEQVLAEVRKAR